MQKGIKPFRIPYSFIQVHLKISQMFINPVLLLKTNKLKLAILTTHTQSTVKMNKMNFFSKCFLMATKNIRRFIEDNLSPKHLVPFERKEKQKQSKRHKVMANSFALLKDADVHSGDDDIVDKDFLHKQNYSLSNQNC